MKIKNFQVLDEQNQKAVNELMNNDLVGATALKVVKVVRKLDELFKDVNEAVKLVRTKFTDKDEKGNPIHPLDEQGNEIKDRIKITDHIAFNKELEQILAVENEIDIEMISEEEIKGVKISPKNIMLLNWLIRS